MMETIEGIGKSVVMWAIILFCIVILLIMLAILTPLIGLYWLYLQVLRQVAQDDKIKP